MLHLLLTVKYGVTEVLSDNDEDSVEDLVQKTHRSVDKCRGLHTKPPEHMDDLVSIA